MEKTPWGEDSQTLKKKKKRRPRLWRATGTAWHLQVTSMALTTQFPSRTHTQPVLRARGQALGSRPERHRGLCRAAGLVLAVHSLPPFRKYAPHPPPSFPWRSMQPSLCGQSGPAWHRHRRRPHRRPRSGSALLPGRRPLVILRPRPRP